MVHENKLIAAVILAGLVFPSFASAQPARKSTTEIKLAAEIEWQQLNPARGDASPQAGTIWGDQTKEGESGFLVKFVDGFASPPHIHNITYRGIVLDGGLHNDDPDAEPMWMQAGSYWTQPAGEAHITAARGASIAYVEIQSGPYLVKPVAEAFDNGERAMNIDASNIVWLDASQTSWIAGKVDEDTSQNPMLTFMWGDPQGDRFSGTLVRLPAGYSGELQTASESLRTVVIRGQMKLEREPSKTETTIAANATAILDAGSYFGSQGKAVHRITCDEECTIYVRCRGNYTLVPRAPLVDLLFSYKSDPGNGLHPTCLGLRQACPINSESF